MVRFVTIGCKPFSAVTLPHTQVGHFIHMQPLMQLVEAAVDAAKRQLLP